MAKKNATQVPETIKEIDKKVEELKKKIVVLGLNKKAGKVKNTKEAFSLRKEVARLLTKKTEKILES